MRWTYPESGHVVEEANPDDAPAVLAIRYAVLAEGKWFITEAHEFGESVASKEHHILDLQRSPNSIFLVARREKRLVGYLTIQGGLLSRMRHVGKLEILVEQASRGKGAGEALLRSCIDWANRNPHLVKIGLNVFADNERAIALYRKLGFVEEGRRPREYRMADGTWRDDVLMYRFVDIGQ